MNFIGTLFGKAFQQHWGTCCDLLTRTPDLKSLNRFWTCFFCLKHVGRNMSRSGHMIFPGKFNGCTSQWCLVRYWGENWERGRVEKWEERCGLRGPEDSEAGWVSEATRSYKPPNPRGDFQNLRVNGRKFPKWLELFIAVLIGGCTAYIHIWIYIQHRCCCCTGVAVSIFPPDNLA